MKALILNSGMGSRMGPMTAEQPKCMTEISSRETILSRQLRQLAEVGIENAVITTGAFESKLIRYVEGLKIPIGITFVRNPDYAKTNYIYSIFCARECLQGDILLLHGDLVFENEVLDKVLKSERSCMTTSMALPLPLKDFKAVVHEGRIQAVGVEFFEHAVAAQPMYKIFAEDWQAWLSRIALFCEEGKRECYAEKALNEVLDTCSFYAIDVGNLLCQEIDTAEDLAVVSARLRCTGGR